MVKLPNAIQRTLLLSTALSAISFSSLAQTPPPPLPLPDAEILSLEDLGITKDDEDSLPVPEDVPEEGAAGDSGVSTPLQSGTSTPPPLPAIAPPPSEGGTPLAPFEPAPAPVAPKEEVPQKSEEDADIEALLLELSREEEKQKIGTPEPAQELQQSPPVQTIEKKEYWWQRPDEKNTQELPEVIYKKEYEERNRHLPKAYDLTDMDRWLFKTAADGDVNGMRAILNKNIDPDPKNTYGNTPLIQAVLHDRIDTARLLLARGANPNAQNKLGLTALHIAAYKGRSDIIKALLSSGSNPNLKNNQGFTPLEFAATNKHYAAAQTLLNGGARRTSRFFSGMIHDRSTLDGVTRGKVRTAEPGISGGAGVSDTEGAVSGPSEDTALPWPANNEDQTEDADILKQALGIEPEGILGAAPVPPLPDAGAASPAQSGEDAAGSAPPASPPGTLPPSMQKLSVDGGVASHGVLDAAGGKKDIFALPWGKPSPSQGDTTQAAPTLQSITGAIAVEVGPSVQHDGVWKPTKGGQWIKVGGSAPPQGVAGIYWHQADGAWRALDPHDRAEAEKIRAIQVELGHTPLVPLPEGAPPKAPKAVKESAPAVKTPGPAKATETPPPASMLQFPPVPQATLPEEVLEDMKPSILDEATAPIQGVGGVYWQEIDGEWQPLDPADPIEAKEIERIKKELGHTDEGGTPSTLVVPSKTLNISAPIIPQQKLNVIPVTPPANEFAPDTLPPLTLKKDDAPLQLPKVEQLDVSQELSLPEGDEEDEEDETSKAGTDSSQQAASASPHGKWPALPELPKLP